MDTKEKFEVEYLEAEAGWIDVDFKNGKDIFSFPISSVYDPFEDWFYALEGIFGDIIPLIRIDTEGDVFEISFIKDDSKCTVKVINAYTNENVFTCKTTKIEILNQMYKKLLEFAKSDRYKPIEYEHDGYRGFPLRNYKNLKIEKHLKQNNNSDFCEQFHCPHCRQLIELKTISTMLVHHAYKTIKKDKNIANFLKFLKLNSQTIGIKQECGRLTNLLSDKTPIYRCIQESEADIYLGFNEDFSLIEMVEISSNLFDKKVLRGYKIKFEKLSLKEKMQFLENTFAKIDENLKNAISFLEFSNSKLTLKPEYKKFNSILGENKFPHIFFNTKDEKLLSIRIILREHKSIKEPIYKWLSQKIITMSPSYKEHFLYFKEKPITLKDLGDYDFENDPYEQVQIADKLKFWQEKFKESQTNPKFDWKEFEQISKKTHEDLMYEIDKEYILVYKKSYEEIYKFLNDDTFEQKEMLLRVQAGFDNSIYNIQEPFQNIANESVDYDYLGLSKKLIDEFEAWQNIYLEEGIYWKNDEIRDDFFAKGLELAKKLKEFLSCKAYVEFEGDVLVNIKYFYISADFGATLWDEKGEAATIEDICDELSIEYKNLKIFQKLLDNWGAEYNQKYLEGNLDIDKFNKDGQDIANELEDALPNYCKIGYLKT